MSVSPLDLRRNPRRETLRRMATRRALPVLAAISVVGCTTDFSSAPDEECGNGIIDSGEACDDGNVLSGDGCTTLCDDELGWDCVGQPSVCVTVCGDGLTAGPESCDDGNPVAGDGCTAQCTLEAGWTCLGQPTQCTPACGDGVLVGDEFCDGAVMAVSDCADVGLGGGSLDCLSDCTLDVSGCDDVPLCGNDLVQYPELCDDGNTTAGDGCSPSCVLE